MFGVIVMWGPRPSALKALLVGQPARVLIGGAHAASQTIELLEASKAIAEAQQETVEKQRAELEGTRRELDSTLKHLRISEELAVARAREFGVLQTELADAQAEVAHWRQRMEAHDTQAFEAVASATEMADKVEELQAEVKRLDAALGVLHAVGKVNIERQDGRIVAITIVDGDGRTISLLDDVAPLKPVEAAAGIANESTTPVGPALATHASVEVLLDAVSPTPSDEGWIEWDGGDIEDGDYDSFPPGVSWGDLVQVEIEGATRWQEGPASHFGWWHDGVADILRYRVVKGGAS